MFSLVKCGRCGHRYVSPRPLPGNMSQYYGAEYFARRDDRGYDDYFSERIRLEIIRVLQMNLNDLGFFSYEAETDLKACLDIGCAAGYSVEYLSERGWDSCGIDVSRECSAAARGRGLNVVCGDYLQADFGKFFDLITMWAVIEHLHNPEDFLARAYNQLRPGGFLYLSTCRAGSPFMLMKGSRWRYYNFPEHLNFFSFRGLRDMLVRQGFVLDSARTYGSGFFRPGTVLRKAADFAAKRFRAGDMMIIAAKKPE